MVYILLLLANIWMPVDYFIEILGFPFLNYNYSVNNIFCRSIFEKCDLPFDNKTCVSIIKNNLDV